MSLKLFAALTLILTCYIANVTPTDELAAEVDYYLYNKETGTDNPIVIKLGSAETANLDPSRPIKFLCHGYLDGIDSEWYASAISEYLQSQNVNIIALDWPATGLYSNTVATAKNLAVVNGQFIKELVDKFGIDLGEVHLIGHSLGAHIFGLTGK